MRNEVGEAGVVGACRDDGDDAAAANLAKRLRAWKKDPTLPSWALETEPQAQDAGGPKVTHTRFNDEVELYEPPFKEEGDRSDVEVKKSAVPARRAGKARAKRARSESPGASVAAEASRPSFSAWSLR